MSVTAAPPRSSVCNCERPRTGSKASSPRTTASSGQPAASAPAAAASAFFALWRPAIRRRSDAAPAGLTRRGPALGIRLTGPVAKVVTRGYHLLALPAMSNRIRVALDWAFQTFLPPDETQLSVVREEDARLASAQATAIYRSTA